MSVQTEITRIQTARNTLRTKAVALGVGLATDNLSQLAAKYDGITDRGTPNAEVQEGQSYTIEPGYYHGGAVKGVAGGGNYNLQAKSVTPTKSEQAVSSDAGYYGLSSVTVGAIPDAYQDVSSVTATAADVLSPAVIVKANGDIAAGTMANNGAVSKTLNTTTKSYTIPAGYHNGSGKVSITTEGRSVEPTEARQTISPASGKVLSSVTVNPIPSKYGDASGATVTAGHILSGDTAIGYDSTTGEAVAVTGTMPDNTGYFFNVAGSIQPKKDGVHPIPDGYHSNSYISIPSLEGLTPVDTGKTAVTAAQMLTGYQAWVEGEKVTGTMTDRGAVTPSALSAGGSYTIPAGYHNGSGKVTAKSLASQTGVDSGKTAVAAAQMLTGYQGWVNGTKVSGTMANNGATGGTITGLGAVTGDTSYTIPAGYTTGGTVSLTSDIENALAAI